jgi:hypothetical protein|tara:strand:+ start:34 stop:1476 length:1443 start_codon:yes stop_codon:yes gene_type:complete
MAYKFQVGPAILSGSLVQEGSVEIKNDAGAIVGVFDNAGFLSGASGVEGASFTADGALTGGSLVVGSADMSETDLEKLDGITNGTGAANKALVLNANAVIASGLVGLTASSGVKAGELEATGHVIAPALISTTTIQGAAISGSGDLNANRLAIGGPNYAAALAQIDDVGAATFASVTSMGNVSGSNFQIAGNVVVANTTRISSAGAATFTSIAGTSISGSGVLSINQIKSSGSIAGVDFEVGGLLKMPDVTSGKILVADGTSFEEVAMSGDIAIASGGATTIQASAVESGMLNANVISGQTELAQGSLDAADEFLISDGGVLKRFGVDSLAKDSGALVSEAAAAVADDYLLFLDGGATGETKKESIADLVASIAGAGLAAADGVLSTQAGAVTQVAEATTALVEGYNYYTGSANKSLTLPASPSVGDVVYLKAQTLGAGNAVTVSRAGSHTIDGNTSVLLESNFGAIGFVYLVANNWGII